MSSFSDWTEFMTTKPLKSIGAAKFKEQCLAILEELDDDGVIITKHGKPVARVVPIRAESAGLIGSLRDRVAIKGDIRSTGIRWDAES